MSGLEPQVALAVLAANMPRIKAEAKLQEADEGKVTLHADELYDLCIEAGKGKAAANSYRVAAIRANWKPRS